MLIVIVVLIKKLRMFKVNCFDLWCNEEKSGNIMTLIQELDHVLNGGITSGIITELCGSPGVGKTQLW